jgi:hypothetical protein
VPEVDALGGDRTSQRGQQVGTVELVVGEAERRLQRLGQRRAQQRAAVVPAALVPRQRLHAGPGQLLGEPEPVEDARGVRADLDAGADLAQRRRLLVHVDVEAGVQQRQRRAEAAEAPADDADRDPLGSRARGGRRSRPVRRHRVASSVVGLPAPARWRGPDRFTEVRS